MLKFAGMDGVLAAKALMGSARIARRLECMRDFAMSFAGNALYNSTENKINPPPDMVSEFLPLLLFVSLAQPTLLLFQLLYLCCQESWPFLHCLALA